MKYTLALKEISKKNIFELEIEYMHGDADAQTFEYELFNDVENIQYRIKRLHLINKYINVNSYNHSNFLTLEEREFLNLEENEEDSVIFDDWPNDITDLSYSYKAPIRGYTIYYYDDNGNKNNVKFESDLIPGVYIR